MVPPQAFEATVANSLPVATEDLDIQVDNAASDAAASPEEDTPSALSVQLPPTEERVQSTIPVVNKLRL
ncbi:hypothetical protein PoB_001864000 [Plakobranchus ocellatus]|uniref:Uncharacterized protein n=1 Tax=Plakobranchus ocellatus TaxID=259542 RepID=A0AAV3Z9C9_9GAST|nr:hypothetical protein PoB_001864000 [Plakobranchus ocellatus]